MPLNLSNFKTRIEGQDVDLNKIFVPKDIFTEGGLWAVGSSFYGQIGDSTTVSKSSPIQTVAGGREWRGVSSGGTICSAVKSDGTLWSWGLNSLGQLGDNSTVNKSSPVQTVSGSSVWRQVSASQNGCSAIKTDGTLWSWGLNSAGQLGDNSTVNKSSPVQTVAGSNTAWKQVSKHDLYTLAVKVDGTLWGWGNNSSYNLGDGTLTSRSSPVQVFGSATTWKQASAGGLSSAIKTDGTMWVWGISDSSPVTVVGGGTSWKYVGEGGLASGFVAIKTDGTLWTSGDNTYGQLGDGTTTASTAKSPVQVLGGSKNWKQVSGAGYSVAAVKVDGTLWAWGLNDTGQLGDGTTVNRSSPVQIFGGGSNWKQVSITSNTSVNFSLLAAVKNDEYINTI
jgi:alpha-tubulin suppressor-like RCC1 family protein